MTRLNSPECFLQVVYRDPVRYKLQKQLTIAAEGLYSGQVRGRRRCVGAAQHGKRQPRIRHRPRG